MKTFTTPLLIVYIGVFLLNKANAYMEDVYLDGDDYLGSGDEPNSFKPSITLDADRGSGEEPADHYDDLDYYEDDDEEYSSGSGWGPIIHPSHPVHPDSTSTGTNKSDNHEIYFSREDIAPVQETPQQPMPSNTPPPTLTGTHDEMDSPITILTNKDDDRQVSIFAQPGILAAFIGGAVMGLLCAILLVMFIVYRMRKRDEGSYPLDEPKRVPLTSSYSPNEKEIYA